MKSEQRIQRFRSSGSDRESVDGSTLNQSSRENWNLLSLRYIFVFFFFTGAFEESATRSRDRVSILRSGLIVFAGRNMNVIRIRLLVSNERRR